MFNGLPGDFLLIEKCTEKGHAVRLVSWGIYGVGGEGVLL